MPWGVATHVFNLKMEVEDDNLIKISNGVLETPLGWSDEHNGFVWERTVYKNGKIVNQELFLISE